MTSLSDLTAVAEQSGAPRSRERWGIDGAPSCCREAVARSSLPPEPCPELSSPSLKSINTLI